jgi:hypothetical protein
MIQCACSRPDNTRKSPRRPSERSGVRALQLVQLLSQPTSIDMPVPVCVQGLVISTPRSDAFATPGCEAGYGSTHHWWRSGLILSLSSAKLFHYIYVYYTDL